MMRIVMIVEKMLNYSLRRQSSRILLLFIVLSSSFSFSQTTIKGTVFNEQNKPIPFVNVFAKKDSLSSIINYSYSDNQGKFKITIKKEGSYDVHFSILGFETKIIKIDVTSSNVEVIKNITLQEKSFSLEEVIITADKAISVKKDTVVFSAKHFLTGEEQSVEDLLKKIPGISVDDSGTIKVGNQEIEKLMVDGDDFFEKGYKVLSKNMPTHPIEKIEVLNNFSNNKLLKNIEISDKVALNLTLKEKFKNVWFGNVDLHYGFGSENTYESRFNLASFGKKNKYFFIGNFNNIGYDAVGDIENLIQPFRSRDEPVTIGDNQRINNLLSLNPPFLSFKKSRTNFNNAELASLNAIFKPIKHLKIKSLAFFNWDETNFFQNGITTVNTTNSNFSNTEDYQLQNNKKVGFGKIDLTYDLSKTKMLEATTKFNSGTFNDNSNLVFNGNSTIENLDYQNTLFDQKINYTDKFKNNKVLLVTGRFIDEKTPQLYKINQFFYQDLFPSTTNANNSQQRSDVKMQFTGINAHVLDRKSNGDLLELQVGNEFTKEELTSQFSLFNNDLLIDQPVGYQNQTNYNVNNLYVKGKYRLKLNDVSITGNLNVHQLFNSLQTDNVRQNQSPFFINPSISLDWEINDNNKITSSFSRNTSNAKTQDVYSNFVLTGFRSFTKGTGSFNQLSSSNLVVNYQLGDWSDRFFANTFFIYNKNHDFFSTNTTIDQNFVQTEKILIQDREFLSINSTLDFYLKKLATNLKANISYSKSEFKNSINNGSLRTVRSNNYNYGLELRSGFKGIFNYHFGTKWTTSEIQTNINNVFTNNVSFLDASFVINSKFNFQLQSERYDFGNVDNNKAYYFLDFDMQYKLSEQKITLGLSAKNLLNTKEFNTFSINDIGSSSTTYRLLPRYAILKLGYQF
ncbi:carboxypeptidase-like regulatory domain-containing protein [Tenacibaculum sp. 190524A05c]|uniref:carboxypeptidase-like regulatory domain-containing protein n=1 Tax=Tenacibaculum platacis TaxID=3137852 RepID=UPI0032B194BC